MQAKKESREAEIKVKRKLDTSSLHSIAWLLDKIAPIAIPLNGFSIH
jgi:hypothetical protein